MLPKVSLTTFNVHRAHSICALPIVFAIALQALYSCAGAPIKPSVEVGVIDYTANQVIENMSGGASFKHIDAIPKATAENITRAIVVTGNRVPLANYDKAICFTPDWWNVEVQYIHSLERYITAHCSGQ